MSLFVNLLLAAYAIAVASLCRSVWLTRSLMREQRAAPAIDADAAGLPSLEVVIPVKDEEKNIARCVESVLHQDYPNCRVIVVNDRSTDRTADVVREIARRNPRVIAHNVAELPPGLYGKPHALQTVAPLLRAEIILFMDSDMDLHRGCLRTLASFLVRERIDWLPVAGRPDLHTAGEKLIVPIVGAVALAWHDPRKTSDPENPDAMGSGLTLCRRSAYEALGGHSQVLRAFDEDSALIRLAKKARQRVMYLMGSELYSVRFHGSLGRTIRGFARAIAGGLNRTLPQLAITANAVGFISLAPFVILGVYALTRHLALPLPLAAGWPIIASIHVIAAFMLARLVYRGAGAAGWEWLHPVGAILTIYICARAAVILVTGRGLTWRGTNYATETPGP